LELYYNKFFSIIYLKEQISGARCRGVGALLPRMEALAHSGVGQRGWGFVRELVALGGQHGERGSPQTGMVLQREKRTGKSH